jgi:pyruvate/2-oxoglutarate dehydrogenase complex dihydrolipoamide dehydrogenase (E3) component
MRKRMRERTMFVGGGAVGLIVAEMLASLDSEEG